MNATKKINCWVLSEGLAGTENQCIGVAEALGSQVAVEYEIKRIQLHQPWKSLSPFLGFESEKTFSPVLQPPWPDVLIAAGRKSIAAARYIKKASGGACFTVQLQDPRIHPRFFDLVAVPAHDRLAEKASHYPNVIVTDASPNRITAEKLSQARSRFPQFSDFKAPRIAVLIGGASRAYRLSPQQTQKLCNALAALPGSLMATTSRRTGVKNEDIVRNTLSGPNHWVWDGQGENPYPGLLAWADYILVTADSASMLSDAGTTGKPVYILPLQGGRRRIHLLHSRLILKGVARMFDGRLEDWSYEPLADSQKIAHAIRLRLKA